MSDIDKGIPIRTENDADQYTRVRLYDPTNAAQGTTVDSDGNAHIEVHGNDPDGTTDRVLRLSELGAVNPDGNYDATNNTKPASAGIVAHARAVAPDETGQTFRPTGVNGTDDNTVHAFDMAMHDHNGNAWTPENPVPVSFEESPGEEIHNYNEAVDVAAGGQEDHELVVANGETLLLEQILAGSSTRFKVELFIGDGATTETFTRKAVKYSSEDQKGADIAFVRPIVVTGTANGTTVRVRVFNRDDDDPASIHTTIVGLKRT